MKLGLTEKQIRQVAKYLIEDNKFLIIWPGGHWGAYWYSEEDLVAAMNSWISFENYRRLMSAEEHISMALWQRQMGMSEAKKEYGWCKRTCAKFHLNIAYFLPRTIDEIDQKRIERENGYKNREKASKNGHIYLIKSWDFWKIWRSKHLENRTFKYVTENPNPVEVVHSYFVENCIEEEKRLHELFDEKKHNREWFNLGSGDVDYIKSLWNIQS